MRVKSRHNKRATDGEGVIQEIVFAVGLVLAFEGLLFAAFPHAMRKALFDASQMPEHITRLVGIASALVGIVVLWGIKAL